MSIQKAIEGFNFDRLTKGLASIEAGIGINTGFVVAGYIGSSRTMSYSVIGDTVNIASRLCAAARPGEIVISEQTHTITADHFVTRPHAPIVAKGKAEPMQAFTVIGARHRGPRPSAPLNPSHELQTTRL